MLLMSSCHSKPQLVPRVKFGDSEQDWHSKRKQLVTDGILEPRLAEVMGNYADTIYLFKLRLGDTSYAMQVEFNADDPNNEGALRMYSLKLTEDTISNTAAKQLQHTKTGFSAFSAPVLKHLKTGIKQAFGDPDSTGKDPLEVWYHMDDYDIAVILPEVWTTSDKDTVYYPLWMHVYSKTYKEDYATLKQSQLDALKPEDVFKVEFNYSQVMHQDERGVVYPALKISAVEESSGTNANTLPIKSAKGTLVIKDAYRDVLLEIPNSQYAFSRPLCCGEGTVFPHGGTGWFLALNSRPETAKLREALQAGSVLTIQFKPEAVLFQNGRVLRR